MVGTGLARMGYATLQLDLLYYILLFSLIGMVFFFIYFKDTLSELWMKIRNTLSPSPKKDEEVTGSGPISKLQARLLLVICAAMYGSNFVGTKILQQTLAPSMITTCRFFIASLFFTRSLLRFQGDFNVLKGGVELGVWTAIGFMVQAITLQYTSANKNAFLCALSVVMIPIFESFMYCYSSKYCRSCQHQNISPPHTPTNTSNLHVVVIPALLSLCGIASLECGGLEPPSFVDAIVLIAPLCFAMGFWRTEQIAAQFPEDTYVITGSLLSTTTLLCLLYSIVSGEFPMSISDANVAYSTIFLDWKVLGGLLYAGIFMTAWSAYAEQSSLKVLTAAETTVIYSLEPLFAAVFSSVFLHEYFGFNSFIGALCIVTACLWNTIIVPTFSTYFTWPLCQSKSPLSSLEHKSVV